MKIFSEEKPKIKNLANLIEETSDVDLDEELEEIDEELKEFDVFDDFDDLDDEDKED